MESSLVYTQGGKIRPVHDSIGEFLIARKLVGKDYETIDEYVINGSFSFGKTQVLSYVVEKDPKYAHHIVDVVLEKYMSEQKELMGYMPLASDTSETQNSAYVDLMFSVLHVAKTVMSEDELGSLVDIVFKELRLHIERLIGHDISSEQDMLRLFLYNPLNYYPTRKQADALQIK